jgi:hypothetical protein
MSFDYSQILLDIGVPDWDYFPNILEDSKPITQRISGKINGETIVYLDMALKDETLYILSGWTHPEYRNLGIMTWFGGEVYRVRPNAGIKNYVWLNAKDNTRSFFERDKERMQKNLLFDNQEIIDSKLLNDEEIEYHGEDSGFWRDS